MCFFGAKSDHIWWECGVQEDILIGLATQASSAMLSYFKLNKIIHITLFLRRLETFETIKTQ